MNFLSDNACLKGIAETVVGKNCHPLETASNRAQTAVAWGGPGVRLLRTGERHLNPRDRTAICSARSAPFTARTDRRRPFRGTS